MSFFFDLGGGIISDLAVLITRRMSSLVSALARHDDRVSVAQRPLAGVEPQVGLCDCRRRGRGTGSSSPTGSAALPAES